MHLVRTAEIWGRQVRCDSPDYRQMEQCDDCGRWREVGHMQADHMSDGEDVVRDGCYRDRRGFA